MCMGLYRWIVSPQDMFTEEKIRFLTKKKCIYCYGRPLLQAWLLPDLNTIPNNCVGKNSL